MTERGILVAGIGNIFLGDDAFGVETVRLLRDAAMPDCVEVVDFGIRSYDLMYTLIRGYDAAIFLDVTRRGRPPGTLYLLELDPVDRNGIVNEIGNAHNVNLQKALAMAGEIGRLPGRVYLVACEPEHFLSNDGSFGLSPAVKKALPQAVDMVLSLIDELITTEPELRTAPWVHAKAA